MFSFKEYSQEIITTIVLLLALVALRIIIAKLVRRYASSSQLLEHRTNLVIKYIHILMNILVAISLIVIWGVETKDIFITVSSIATVIGVAMFAQWSILSNVTSGMILFFSFPFRIGDTIKIHDKDFPIEAEIEDISAFHVNLKTKEGEKIIYPNNLLLQKGISIMPVRYEDKEFFD
ncbi:mechanosensitive ion channel domain-containing protein [Flavobacterium branchiicola]|uniref:Mechanosensitive ion channel domain-containing protein n=1 Tax=Flavobacterium branchiicola TaxID=1114875 RepID=A0ABV9PDR0_9FLAO|nr:mechanosensitive ion channel domain-containing protein [Flavobacterium branchiicola]MBS7253772.1 mechanosensitive ion channel [Flavobacterium branchiicola]